LSTGHTALPPIRALLDGAPIYPIDFYQPVLPPAQTELSAELLKQRNVNREQHEKYKLRHPHYEKNKAAERLNDFNLGESPAYAALKDRFGERVTRKKMLSIAQILSGGLRIAIDREAKRRRDVMIKWFDENWAAIEPHLDKITLPE
jgi:hypothetical protein